MNETYVEISILREFIRVFLYSFITLYMMVILLRWTSPFLSIDMDKWWYRWILR